MLILEEASVNSDHESTRCFFFFFFFGLILQQFRGWTETQSLYFNQTVLIPPRVYNLWNMETLDSFLLLSFCRLKSAKSIFESINQKHVDYFFEKHFQVYFITTPHLSKRCFNWSWTCFHDWIHWTVGFMVVLDVPVGFLKCFCSVLLSWKWIDHPDSKIEFDTFWWHLI